MNCFSQGGIFNPAAFQYADFMDPRFQNSFRSAVGPHPHASPMYPHFPSYAQLYNTLLPMQTNASLSPMIPGMMKMVEEDRMRLLREEELRQQERQKEIQRQKEAQREKERKEREREQRER